MATPNITDATSAAQNGWSIFGSGSNWRAEKVVQEGMVLAVGATSAALLGSIQACEYQHGKLAMSPMRDKGHTWKGHI